MHGYDPYERFERAELYRLFARIFIHEPLEDDAISLKEMFLLTFDNTIDEIKSDYYNLFYSKDNLLPLESFYRRFEIPPWKVIDDALNFYHSTGITLDDEINIPPDHISSELIFMSYLIENNLIKEQRLFFKEHIMKWVPDFCDELPRKARTLFFKEVSEILKEFILAEQDELSEIS